MTADGAIRLTVSFSKQTAQPEDQTYWPGIGHEQAGKETINMRFMIRSTRVLPTLAPELSAKCLPFFIALASLLSTAFTPAVWAGFARTIDAERIEAGRYGTSIGLRVNGLGLRLPVISYGGIDPLIGQRRLFLYLCHDPYCETGESVPSFLARDGERSAIAIRQDGTPIVVHRGQVAADGVTAARSLLVSSCGNTQCTNLSSRTLLAHDGLTANPPWDSTAIVIRSDGRPLIAFVDLEEQAIRRYDCFDDDCSNGSFGDIDTDIGPTGGYLNMSMRSDGRPIISYRADTGSGYELRIADCQNTQCQNGSSEVIANAGTNLTEGTAIAVRGDDLPVVIFNLEFMNQGSFIDCLNENCSMRTQKAFIASSDPALAIRGATNALFPVERPIASFRLGSPPEGLAIMDCIDNNCSNNSSNTRLLDSGNVGEYSDIAVNTSSIVGGVTRIQHPVISYYDEDNGALKIYSCISVNCQEGLFRDGFE